MKEDTKKTSKAKLKTKSKNHSKTVSVTSEEPSQTEKSSKPPKASKIHQSEPQTMDELLSQIQGSSLGVKRGETVEGVVVSVTPREVLVDIGKKSYGIIANWELEQVKDYAATLKTGDRIVAQVVNPENDMGYIVLSIRKTSTERRWTILEEKKSTGEDIEVIGLEIAKGGLLIEWQNLRGFIPATQLDAFYSANPQVLIGKQIKVKVLEVDKAVNRLVLSQKAAILGVSPTILKEKLGKIKTNDILKGVISGIAPFGLFVDINGLEGLVHISEIAWERVENPADFYKVGDQIEVSVLDVNQEEGKLNLSVKRLTPDPWKNILDRYPPDTAITGKVVRLASYGVFVNVETGIEGLIHISKIPAGQELKVAEEVECIIEKIDPIKRKISLTIVPKEKPVGYR